MGGSRSSHGGPYSPVSAAPDGLVSAGSTIPDTAASPAATTVPGAPARNTHFLYAKYRKIVPNPVPTTLATL